MITDDLKPSDGALPAPYVLQPGEALESHATSADVVISVTTHRLVMTEGARTIMDLPFSALRRVQFDIERGRPASLVIVPESHEPRVVEIQVPDLRETALTLAAIGGRLNDTAGSRSI